MGRTRYNHTPRTPGVYYIVNTKTLKTYIGSTKNIYERFCVHKAKLKSNICGHTNPELQADYNVYGSDSFEFIVVKECDSVEEAHEGELELIQNYPNKNFLYNLKHTGKPTAQAGLKRPPHSAATRARISASCKGKRLSDEHRARLSEANKGRRLSDEHRARVSEAQKGKRLSDEHRARISEAQKLRYAERRQAAVDERLTCTP